MGVRTTGRKLAMQIIYQMSMRTVELPELKQQFMEQSQCAEATKSWALDLATGAWGIHEQSDKIIKKLSIDWDLKRINPIDKSILRIALYELLNTDTPMNVVLNEAIEIAKKYSTEESAKFINGILGNYVKSCSQA